MKKIFFIICISFCLICNSNAAGYKVGNKVSDVFEPVRNFKIDLPPGEWVVTQSANDAFYGLRWRSYILVRLENGKFAEAIAFEEIALDVLPIEIEFVCDAFADVPSEIELTLFELANVPIAILFG